MPDNVKNWFPFYPEKWLTGTMDMTYEEKGLYIDILAILWDRGPQSESDLKVILKNLKAKTISKFLTKFSHKLIQTKDGRYTNSRLEIEREKALASKEKASQKARLAADARWRSHQKPHAPSNAPSIRDGMLQASATACSKQCLGNAHDHDHKNKIKSLTPSDVGKLSGNQLATGDVRARGQKTPGSPAGPSVMPTEEERERAGFATLPWVLAQWNAIAGVTPVIPGRIKAGGPYRKRIEAVIKKHPKQEWWNTLFDEVKGSDYLCGLVRDWRADLFWTLGPINLDKVLMQTYRNKPRTGSRDAWDRDVTRMLKQELGEPDDGPPQAHSASAYRLV